MRPLISSSLDVLVLLLSALIAIASIVVGGIPYVIIFAGMFFIIIGIHENTKRTAAAVEKLAAGNQR